MRHLKNSLVCFSMGKTIQVKRNFLWHKSLKNDGHFVCLWENFVGSNYKTKCRTLVILAHPSKSDMIFDTWIRPFFWRLYILRWPLEFWIQGWYFILDPFYPLEIRLKWRNARDAFSDTHITHTFQQATKSFLGDKNLPTQN